MVETNCLYCNSLFFARPSDLKRGHSKFCSRKCSGLHQRISRKIDRSTLQPNAQCAFCQVEFYMKPSSKKNSRSGLYFCCREHKDVAQRIGGIKQIQPPHYSDAKRAYRTLALRTYGEQCQDCGYDKYVQILEVHHIDGDRTNNKIENLRVLCKNCHGLYTYGLK